MTFITWVSLFLSIIGTVIAYQALKESIINRKESKEPQLILDINWRFNKTFNFILKNNSNNTAYDVKITLENHSISSLICEKYKTPGFIKYGIKIFVPYQQYETFFDIKESNFDETFIFKVSYKDKNNYEYEEKFEYNMNAFKDYYRFEDNSYDKIEKYLEKISNNIKNE